MPDLQIAIYARVSSEQQARGNTVDSQVAALRDRIGANGVALEAEDVFVDEGFSGTTLRRPALERLRDRVAGGGWSTASTSSLPTAWRAATPTKSC